MAAPDPPAAFRQCHVDILRLLVRGYGNAAIARQLGVPIDTVRSRLRRIQALTGCCGRVQLAYAAARWGWLEPRPVSAHDLTPELVGAVVGMARLVQEDAPIRQLRPAAARVHEALRAAGRTR